MHHLDPFGLLKTTELLWSMEQLYLKLGADVSFFPSENNKNKQITVSVFDVCHRTRVSSKSRFVAT